MIDIYPILDALYTQIKSNAVVLEKGIIVKAEEYLNMDPDIASDGWCCVYKGNLDYEPGSLGRHSQSWDADLELTIVVQASNGDSGLACSKKLSEVEQTVLDAVWADSTLGGNVATITSFKTNPMYKREASETLYFQSSLIMFTGKVRTG